MPRDELLTLDTVLAELGENGKPLPRSTFHDWRAKGRAPRCIKLPNGTLRIRRSEFTRWLDTHEEAA
ncbi:MAG TPA: transcriptional regulator [Actinocrinis sp.]|uniref:helix-turn-helix transcriptional regulator n=1 Tax=Actinocrinis sp. TaxID=1920516 RepID=UPI002DDD045B|nr:transcriptional regulator [Actinocrinis sp.]HEV2343438.1 transcriptional regulator [Actinocrinis sp.]